MQQEFNLSNRIWKPYQVEKLSDENRVIFFHDVLEFIRLIKEEAENLPSESCGELMKNAINNLAGDYLIFNLNSTLSAPK